jgi:hypothetical protein
MMKRDRRVRRGVADRHPPVLPVFVPDQHEVARFLRPQPPASVPPVGQPRRVPGLIGLSVLGFRVIRHNEGGR